VERRERERERERGKARTYQRQHLVLFPPFPLALSSIPSFLNQPSLSTSHSSCMTGKPGFPSSRPKSASLFTNVLKYLPPALFTRAMLAVLEDLGSITTHGRQRTVKAKERRRERAEVVRPRDQ
jgi:hypothetical protein